MYLSEINIYPIKSLSGISLKSSIIEERGLRFDRRWMLVNEKNEFLTQREFPKMTNIKTNISDDGLQVFFDKSELIIPFEPDTNQTQTVKIWSSRCRARVYGQEINQWFSDALETNCRLVLMPEETKRKVNYFYAVHKEDTVSFADGYPFLLTCESSLADLNSKMEKPVTMNRFRPNFVISGADSFAEDGWRKIKIGDVIFHIVKPCARCVVTTIDQLSGEKQGTEPLKTLATFRVPKRSVKKKILFGQNLIADTAGGTVKIGDKIEVLETKNKPKFL